MGPDFTFADTQALLDLIRYQHQQLVEIFALTNPRSTTPLQDTQAIRIKAQAAINAPRLAGVKL